jgi:hypothetical protein
MRKRRSSGKWKRRKRIRSEDWKQKKFRISSLRVKVEEQRRSKMENMIRGENGKEEGNLEENLDMYQKIEVGKEKTD